MSSQKPSTPGEYPYTRGLYKEMYKRRLWTMRQYSGFRSAYESNQRYKKLLERGQMGLSVAFDLPTQMGYDSDANMSLGEVGRVGVPISTIEDMEVLLKDLPIEKISTSMTINSTAGILLAFYIAVAKRRGVSLSALSGTVQNDVLKEYMARGTYIYPPQPSLRLISDIMEYCHQNLPRWNTISVSGYHIREAGSTVTQEIAFTLANAITYVESALKRGLGVDDFAPRISFFFNVSNDFLEEVAKFRAARTLWAQIMKERFHAKKEKSCMLRVHAQTSGATLTAQQPENNIVRVTLQALAAVLGGTQSLHTNAMDEALSLPTESSAILALRTQQIIAHESGVPQVPDPFGGSECMENLTQDIIQKCQEHLTHIQNLGGVLRALESGWFQSEIHNSAYQKQKISKTKKK